MIWTISGAALVLYECWAIARKRITVSRLAHQFPYSLLVWGWWAGLAIHLVREWRLDEARQARPRN